MLKVKKCWHHLLWADVISFFVTRWCQKIQKIDENWWKLANFDREFLHILWTTRGNSMKFSGKMYLKIILKLTKNQGFTLSLEDKFFEKPQGGSNWPPSRFRVKRGEHIPCGYSMSTIWVFYHIENKHTLYRRKNCMKKFCSSLREHEKNIIDFEKIKMLPLTKKKLKSLKMQKFATFAEK